MHIKVYAFLMIFRQYKLSRLIESIFGTLQAGKSFALICLLPGPGGFSFYNSQISKHIYYDQRLSDHDLSGNKAGM